MSTAIMQEPATTISKARIESLIDGIFAFSMTLLVASLIFPNAMGDSANTIKLVDLLWNLAPDIMYYAISFMILSNYWLLSNQLHTYLPAAMEMHSVRIIFASLILVAIMPVSTVIAATYGGNPYSDVILEANLFAIGILFSLHWWQIIRKPDIQQDPVSRLQGCIALRKNLVTPLVASLAIIIAIAGVPWSIALLVVVPFLETWAKKSCYSRQSG